MVCNLRGIDHGGTRVDRGNDAKNVRYYQLVRAPDVLIKSGALLWEQLDTVSLESITQS